MDLDGFDFQAFAHLRGRKEKTPLRWGILVSGVLFLTGFYLLLSEMGWTATGF